MFFVRNILLLILLVTSLHAAPSNLIIYDAPANMEAAPEYKLEVDGRNVFVYNTRSAAFAYFSFDGKVDVKVTFASQIYDFDIRPKSKNIEGEQYRNQIQFALDKPLNLSVEINKNLKRPLFIFANPLETNVPDKKNNDVLFFEKGKIHTPGEVLIKSDQTVYIEGGAVVRGHFKTNGSKNVKITGRGILDNRLYTKGQFRPIEINQSEHVEVSGIIIAESRHWTCASHASRHVVYDNLKVVSSNDWDDGIDIVGSQHIMVNNCFIQSKDDCIAIKAGTKYFTDFSSEFIVNDVVIQNSVLWNGDWGNALEIGFETRADTIKNITFRNCDIIHAEGPEGTFTIHNGDRAVITNILYEDIRVEDSRGWLIDFRILESVYSKDDQRGKIENVHFKNIFVEGEKYPSSQMLGFNDVYRINRVTLEDFFIHGNKITSIYNGMISIAHIENLEFK
ncbi:MAG: glycosyl hydrolase family 28 protein [Mariniphaga sp.]|nr:glycosyl hydrolase family 28 protein [Mariniphaga sp.]MDD4425139.1 glycosyl hydrolase family 28 protein [Mariniphaga sp.]